MAMMITKFNKMIRNKVIWVGFTIIVVLSFAFLWGTNTGGGNAEQLSTDAGTLNGETISNSEFDAAFRSAYIGICLSQGRGINLSPDLRDALHDMSWQRIAAIRKAADYGITCSDDEMIQNVRNFEFLRPGGTYSQQAYDQFADQFLRRQLGVTKRHFEEYVRQEIITQKLAAIVDRMQVISPREIARTYSMMTDIFDVEYVRLTTELVEDDVEVTEEDALAFYNEDPEQFEFAEKVKVKAAVFPVEDFVDSVEISEAEIKEYYDFNIDQFVMDEDEEEESTNLFASSFTTYKPIEEVSDEIEARLAKMQAAVLAENKANEFVQAISDRRDDGREAFDDVAADFGTEMIMVTPFSIRQTPKELEAGLLATRAAFNLTDDPDYFYSDPVVSSNFVYVLSLIERQPPRIPEFEEVKDDVTTFARLAAVNNKLTETGQEIIEKGKDAIKDGKTFDDVLAGYGLSSTDLEPFSLTSSQPEEGFPEEIIRDVLVCNEGEFTELIPTREGEILIAHVKKRSPSLDNSPESMRMQILSTLRRQSSQVMFNDFQDYLLTSGDFEDKIRGTSVKEEPEAEEAVEETAEEVAEETQAS